MGNSLWNRQLIALAIMLAAAIAAPANATGTLYCTIDDRNLAFELFGNTRVADGVIVDVHQGRLALKPGRYAKKTAEFAVTKDNLFMQWVFDRELRFAVRLDDVDNHRAIILAVIAVGDKTLEKYRGRYVLQFVGSKTESLEGQIKSCAGD